MCASSAVILAPRPKICVRPELDGSDLCELGAAVAGDGAEDIPGPESVDMTPTVTSPRGLRGEGFGT